MWMYKVPANPLKTKLPKYKNRKKYYAYAYGIEEAL